MNETSQRNQADVATLVGWSLAFGVVSLATITGNSIAIAVLTRKRLLRRRTSYFLLSLAVADLTVGMFSVPAFIYQIVSFWQDGFVSKSTLLSIVKALDVFCGLGSTFTLTIIALERVYAICFPLRHFYRELQQTTTTTATRTSQNKRLSKTMAMHVRYKSLYISLPFSAKKREIIKFCKVWGTRPTTANFLFPLRIEHPHYMYPSKLLET